MKKRIPGMFSVSILVVDITVTKANTSSGRQKRRSSQFVWLQVVRWSLQFQLTFVELVAFQFYFLSTIHIVLVFAVALS